MSDRSVETLKEIACEWTVSGMDCGSCASKVRRAVERLPGVSDVEVLLMRERLRLSLDPERISREDVEETVRALGYSVSAPDKARRSFVLPGGGNGGAVAAVPGADAMLAIGAAAGPAAATGTNLVAPDSADGGHVEAGHVHGHPADTGKSWYQTAKGRLVILTGSLLVLAWGVELLTPADVGSRAFVLACLVGVAPVAQRAFAALRSGLPFTIEMLMTIAAVGALFIGAAEEAALVVFLFAVGEVLEGVAADRARASIRALAALVPKSALLVEEDGTTREVDAASLRVGQVILARPGDRIAADGEVVEGTSGVDQSPVTGESVPVTRGPGDPVFAGSINTEAALRVRVTKAAEDNTLSRIIALVEEAEIARAPTERFIDRFSRWYMPAVVGVALLAMLIPPLFAGGDWGTWIYRGLALLLIGCPCALVISVPASIASGLSSGARRGLLMKGGAVIEATAKVSRVAFDKTGTLTHGKPRVTDVTVLRGSENDLMALAAGVESGASHPLALAISAEADRRGVPVASATGGRAVPGRGAEASIDGATVCVGSPRLADERGALDDDLRRRVATMEAEGKTVVIVLRENVPLGLITLRDEPRADAAVAIAQLRRLGISSVMLTGDNPRTAQAIAGGLGIDHRAEFMPEDKVAAIRGLTSEARVMMIGDGINDAPALAAAHVGVAMGSGTDVALETADAAILRNRVTDVAGKIRLARATMANIRQNIAIALGLKAVFLVTTVLGITGLWIAILADTGATVLVTLNALRLLFYRPSGPSETTGQARQDTAESRSGHATATT